MKLKDLTAKWRGGLVNLGRVRWKALRGLERTKSGTPGSREGIEAALASGVRGKLLERW